MTSYSEALNQFCESEDCKKAILEYSLALWQEYPGMKMDSPLVDPPHGVVLYANGSWKVLSKSDIHLNHDGILLHFPILDLLNLANILNHTGATEREYLSDQFDEVQDTLIAEMKKSLLIAVIDQEGT